MNKDDVLAELVRLLGSIHLASEFLVEFVALISNSGYEDILFALLTARIYALGSLGIMVTKMKEFEPVGDGIFSLHLAGRGFNIRILFGFLPNREPVFLHPFYERQGKAARTIVVQL